MTDENTLPPILVPIDFSSYSEPTLLQAIQFAECIKATIVVLHVVHDPAHMPGYYSQYSEKKHLSRIEDLAKEMFDKILAKIADKHPDINFQEKIKPMLVVGLPATRILQVIDKISPAMVVMGCKGVTGLKHLMLGSVAEQVVRLSPVLIAIVK